jgi:hypothetical protein
MEHHVLELGSGGEIPAASAVFSRYLPGLSLGLVPLGPRRLLVPASTMYALAAEYGASAVPSILALAGVTGTHSVDDGGAIALVRARDPSQLSSRSTAQLKQGNYDWHLSGCFVPEAWSLVGGPAAIDWRDVRVGQIDTGYARHPVFGFGAVPWLDESLAHTFFAASDSMDDPGPGGGIDPMTGVNGGHGTKTGSTICGFAADAPGGAFYGVAPKVPLVPVRIASAVLINHAQDQFAQAVDHLIDNAKVGVISLSMGIFPRIVVKRLRKALDRAYESGVIVVCAAGQHVTSVVAPACNRRTIAVAGVVPSLQPWAISSHGEEVDISGPADQIRRAVMKRGRPIYEGGGDGTSFATAMTAGAAALWLAHHGSALSQAYPHPWQRVEAFKHVLRTTVQVPPGWRSGSFGTGVLNVHAVLSASLPTPASNPDKPA